jgi:Ala-tRNA(Pro) deacylase
MSIAIKVSDFLAEHDVEYDVLTHAHTTNSGETAKSSHVPGARLAKSVVLEDDQGYLMVVLPASRRVDLGELHRTLNRNLGLAMESELGHLFSDCEMGALPAIGPAYGVETIVDDALAEQPELSLPDLVRLVEERFGVSVHRRSIERALARQEKKRR